MSNFRAMTKATDKALAKGVDESFNECIRDFFYPAERAMRFVQQYIMKGGEV